MEQIRVKRGIDIGVNDNGDYITLDLDNTLFLQKFNGLKARISEIANSIDTTKEVTEEEAVDIMADKMLEMLKAFDDVLGAGSCDKVFGVGVIPTPLPIFDFLEQLEPIVNKHFSDRQKHINAKYAPRKGGK